MLRIQDLKVWLTLSSVDPVLVSAQYEEVRRKLPFLYAMVSLNVASLAYTRGSTAPLSLTVWFSAALFIVSLARFTTCFFDRTGVVSSTKALYLLRRTTLITFCLSIAYFAWLFLLNRYGGDREHITVVLFIMITVIGGLFCFTHLPQAAVILSLIAFMPFVCVLFDYRDPLYTVIAINLLFVLGIVLAMLARNYQSFKELILLHRETERLNREITSIANTDALTGLPNRRIFFLEAEALIEDQRRKGGNVSLGLIDLDRFKAVNDTHGHMIGDRLLETVGKRLLAIFAPVGKVARLGGDEFAFVVPTDGATAEALGNEACRVLCEPFELGAITVMIGGSCGIDVAGEAAPTANALYVRADSALYESKAHRRGAATIFEIKEAKVA